MRIILFSLLACVLGYAGLSVLQSGDGGYVKIYLGGYLLELQIIPFVLFLLALYILVRIAMGLLRSPRKLGIWRKTRNEHVSQNKLSDGFLCLMKGDWQKAEKALMAKAQHSRIPVVNYLAAAQAAQEQGKYNRRDSYLSQAMQEAPKSKLAISMTKARLHQQAGQHEQALSTLLDVESDGKRNPQFIAMLAQAYDQLDDFAQLEHILPQAQRLGALPEEVLADMRADIDLTKFDQASDKDSAWKSLSKQSRQDAKFVNLYVHDLLKNNKPDAAEKLIRNTLKQVWDDDLVNVYGTIQSTQRKKLLRQVEGWLLARPENAELHLAAGRLALQNRDIELAKASFEEAIKLSGLPEAYEELGHLCEDEQDLRKALTLYRSGLSRLNHADQPALPDATEDSAADDSEVVAQVDQAEATEKSAEKQ